MPVRRKNRKGKSEWYARIKFPGQKPIERRCDSKKQAEEVEVLARARSGIFATTGTISLAYLAERHLDHVKARLKWNSYIDKQAVFRALLQFIPPTTLVTEVSYARIEAFLNKVASDISGSRANKYRTHLLRAYNWGIRALDLPAPNPWMVEKYKEDKQPRYVPSEADFWKVFAEASEQDQRMLLTYLHTGARMREIFCLDWTDVDFEQRLIRLWTEKRKGGREFDWIVMTDDLTEALREQRLQTGLSRYVFINPKSGDRYYNRADLMKELCEKAGVRHFGFHAIRHLTASILDRAGLPLSAIQSVLRHKSSHTTARYLHSLGGTRVELNKAFGGAWQEDGVAQKKSGLGTKLGLRCGQKVSHG